MTAPKRTPALNSTLPAEFGAIVAVATAVMVVVVIVVNAPVGVATSDVVVGIILLLLVVVVVVVVMGESGALVKVNTGSTEIIVAGWVIGGREMDCP